MANEYLKRTPTSTGNRRVFTWSSWIKRGKLGLAQNIFCSTEPALISKLLFDGNNKLIYQNNSPSFELTSTQIFRDVGSWMHILFVANTTASIESERIQIFVNGTRLTSFSSATYPAVNSQLIFNYGIGHWISSESSNVNYFEGEFTDIFFVDGQALTPDVFGFNKPGKGYISVGSTQSTDFRPGQWVPKTPRVIKTAINNNGGFGVNGFYLPMNDSNNFGADFHGTPNSIIKLQENLPQPRCRIDGVGDYTGALREDPFKQYLVLALPFVSGGLQNGFGDYSAAIRGSGSPKSITNTGVSIANTASYYGSAGSFNGSSSFMTASMGSDLSFGTDDFTIEFWAYVLNNSTNAYIFDTNVNGMVIGYGNPIGSPSLNRWRYYNGNNGSWTLYTSNPEPVLNQWTHIALCRSKGRTTFYVNGVATSTELDTTNYTNVNSSTLNIGRYGTGGLIHNGYLQDLRVYKGVAKYTGGFDVPRPYTPVGIATWRAVPDTTANNFATWNPLIGTPTSGNVSTLVNGNLTKSQVNASRTSSTILTPKTGKWYAEFHASGSGSIFPYTGVALANSEPATIGGQSNAFQVANTNSYTGVNYHLFNSATTQAETNPPGLGDILGVALDVDNGIVYYYKNGTLLRTDNTLIKSENYVFLVQTTNDGAGGTAWYTSNANFGQNPTFSGNTSAGTFTDSNGKGQFRYQPPTGFLALCEDNLPKPTIEDPGKHFKTVLWTGDGNSGRSITGIGFTPDLVWIKKRAGATENHNLFDSVRGANIYLQSNTTGAEASAGIPMLTSFNNDGFSLGSNGGVNENNHTFAAWCWKAGNTTQTNTNGSITSTVSVNQTAGFSIVSWTGNGAATVQVGHGLGKTPAFMILKARDAGAYDSNWVIFHKSMGSNTFDKYMLFTTGGAGTLVPSLPANSNIFTSSNPGINSTNIRYITYCWAEIDGFSKMGSYVGDGSEDGPFVYCGFKPAWVMIKSTDGTNGWIIMDNARKPTNPNGEVFFANDSMMEQTDLNFRRTDFVSNGFKIRAGIGSERNSSGVTYIFVAFAESPFQTANSK